DLTNLLTSSIAEPTSAITSLPLLGPAELEQLIESWRGPRATCWAGQDRTLHELIEEQVERSADAIALISQREQVSYGELNRRANQLAHYLRELGVGPEVIVGVYLERSPEKLITMLGVLK